MPAQFEEAPEASEEAAAPAAPAEGGGDAPALSAEAQKIPANLLKRSRAARIRLLGRYGHDPTSRHVHRKRRRRPA